MVTLLLWGQVCPPESSSQTHTLGAFQMQKETLGVVLPWPVEIIFLLRFPIGSEVKSSAGF